MPDLYGWALYTPHGRISDWFPDAASCPQPRKWRDYRASDLEVVRAYVGYIPIAPWRFWDMAARDLGYEACRSSKQAAYRDQALRESVDVMLADVPSESPAD